jgi:hypothetical protein
MNAYDVVGPTKVKPRERSSFDIATASLEGPSRVRTARVIRFGLDALSGSNLQTKAAREPNSSMRSSARPALPIADSIFPRWRTIPGSASRRATSFAENRATFRWVEAGERAAERVPLPQDRQPREARLEPFEADLLEEPPIVRDGNPPLLVVVGDVVLVGPAPEAARTAIRSDDHVRRRSQHLDASPAPQ